MQTKKSYKHKRQSGRNKPETRLRKLERVTKGYANHRRIEILELLAKEPELSVVDITELLHMQYKASAPHVQKLAATGLIMKRHDGAHVRHAISPLGVRVLAFLRTLA